MKAFDALSVAQRRVIRVPAHNRNVLRRRTCAGIFIQLFRKIGSFRGDPAFHDMAAPATVQSGPEHFRNAGAARADYGRGRGPGADRERHRKSKRDARG